MCLLSICLDSTLYVSQPTGYLFTWIDLTKIHEKKGKDDWENFYFFSSMLEVRSGMDSAGWDANPIIGDACERSKNRYPQGLPNLKDWMSNDLGPTVMVLNDL